HSSSFAISFIFQVASLAALIHPNHIVSCVDGIISLAAASDSKSIGYQYPSVIQILQNDHV
ncbi:hypothetical protein KKI93_24250, partial [Xenorhabdus bovienii]|uniref:hypothetical protein n=1 Tax=Xenorhabdus bovienii TaxID=40576 RepID=UPI0023B31E80